MKRFEAWPELMNEYVRATMAKKFAWGTFDCCTFAADGVKEMTGEDFLAEFRGKYSDAASAYRVLLDYAGGGIYPMMQKLAVKFGWEEIATIEHAGVTRLRHAQRGDIVMASQDIVETDDRFDGSLGICCGTICVFVGENNVRAISTLENKGAPPNIIHAWRIKIARD